MVADLAKAAAWYAQRGWPVLPLHNPVAGACSCHQPECKSPAKHPRTVNGLKDATVQIDQIALWWQHAPNANIGIVTGKASGLFVVDVDPCKGGYDSLAELVTAHGPLPATPLSLTGGGGEHYLFRYPAVAVGNSAGGLGPGLDTRGAGGYVVVPPSLHMSGSHYQWEASCLPTMALATVPHWMMQLLTAHRATIAAPVLGPILEGNRDQTLTSLAGTMRRRGMSEAAILAALEVENQRCVPPLDPDSLRRIAHSMSRYQPPDSPRTSAHFWTVQPA